MAIGELAAYAGVRTSRIRYYESVGVLPPAERRAGHRRYTIDALRRLAIIDVAQRAGFSLEEVRELLSATDSAQAHERVRALARAKLPAVERLIERTEAVKRWLEIASACECSTLDKCALFDDRALGLPPRTVRGDVRDLVRVLTVPGAPAGKNGR